ncbi:MAG: cysteine desulfurase family protein [Planctomycetota bacterium]
MEFNASKRIYLDNNATTAMDPEVARTVYETLQIGPSNPSSQHASGQVARTILEDAVEEIGKWLDCDLTQTGGPRLIVTSGGTESNNLALRGLVGHDASKIPPNSSTSSPSPSTNTPLVISEIEHPSVLAVGQHLERAGREVRRLPVDTDGVVRVERLAKLIDGDGQPKSKAGLVSVMSANNETGVIQPVEAIAELCRAKQVPLHIDATQSVGKVPFSPQELGAAAVTFAAHKFHGPAGVGALWLNQGVNLVPLLHGGEQQLASRPGTEPVALVAGMATAIRIAVTSQREVAEHTRSLRDNFERALQSLIPNLVIHGRSTDRLPNTSCVSLPGTDRQSLLMALDFLGVECSSGSACSSGSSPPSHVLTAMGCGEQALKSALRFGVSKFSTEQEVSRSVDLISSAYNRLRNG